MNKTTPNNQHDNNCIDLFKQLSNYIDRELDAATYQKIKQHLKNCSPCHACLETLKRTSRLCNELKPTPVPKSLSLRLKKLIEDMK
jgi:anti-sigma factor RsiW